MTSRRIEKRGENGEENRFPSVGRLSSQADDGVAKKLLQWEGKILQKR